MMNPAPRRRALGAAVLALPLSVGVASAQTFDFAVDQETSGLAANLGFDADTAGFLVGDWSPTNPGGTRTMPGLMGAFGAGENEPVAVAMGFSLAGDLETPASGSFRVVLEEENERLVLERFAVNLLAGGPVGLPALVSVAPESFRTRGPDSSCPGVPLELPTGDVVARGLTLVQTGGSVAGVLTELEHGRYAFAVIAPAELHLAVDLNGWPLDMLAPASLALSGEITVVGRMATLRAGYTIEHAEVQSPRTRLPRFAAELPTSLGSSASSHLLMDLSLEELGSSLVGRLTLNAASGTGCAADYDADGSLSSLDAIEFLHAWGRRAENADINGDGATNSLDVVDFLRLWSAGC